MKYTLCLFALVLVIATAGQCQIIGHSEVDLVDKLPQSVMDSVGHQKWFFTHASVGGNMISGMTDLHNQDATRYQLTVSSVSYSNMQASDPPSSAALGCIYECNRGNPGWSSKFTIFDNSVRLAGWCYPNVDFCMDKLCYIDQDASADDYISSMSALEALSPTTIFVYTTMPLMTSSDSSNVLRNQYNEAVRTYCSTNKKLLLDIADIEAYDPNGVEQTFQYNSATWQKLYSGYTSDGGHLNSTGRQRVAKGWYAVAAATVPYGVNNRGAADVVTGAAASKKWFMVWGKVATPIDADSFWLDDGAGKKVKVVAPAHNEVNEGDMVKVWGAMDNSTGTAVITTTAGRITDLN
ncbi:MAG: hypothetical protein ABFD49_11765 [Armatimonadota bacterium]|nr:hypothetical protein [bacterium]